MRPGRFDKKIAVPKPDIKGRKDIINLYLKKVAHDENIDVHKLATMTPGFTGAEIENFVNTAVTSAIHKDKDKADMFDFEQARDRILMGIERKQLSMTEKERLNTAIHEAGHTIAAYNTPGAAELHKVTIVSRGGALGVTFFLPKDSPEMTKQEILASIDSAMGGHVAEELYIGSDKVTTGCTSDLDNATNLAYAAVRQLGFFGEDIGFMVKEKREFSDKQNALIDKKV